MAPRDPTDPSSLTRRQLLSRAAFGAGLLLAAALGLLAAGPIPQDPAYHRFADARSFAGIPNALNVLSNLAFLAVGLLGWRRIPAIPHALRLPARVLWAGVLLTAFGSAYYHWNPTDATLFWDRLPMAVGFAGLFALVLTDQYAAGPGILWALVAAGVASLLCWVAFDDLRAYALVQFFPLAIVLLIATFEPPNTLARRPIFQALGLYALAKLAEHFDAALFESTRIVSGHTLKHLLAAAALARLLHIARNDPPA